MRTGPSPLVRLAIDPLTWRRFRGLALEEGMHASELLAQLVREYVDGRASR